MIKLFLKIEIFIFLLFISLNIINSTYAENRSIKNNIGMEFVLIPAGSFIMGSHHQFRDIYKDKKRPHKVTISNAFYMGKYEVTQAQWVAIMEDNPSKFNDDLSKPVERVAWEEVQIFINKLNKKEGLYVYRLPTEAEWEYAARAGTVTAYCYGDDPEKLCQYAWYTKNSGGKTHPVGQLKPNEWGLYDMHGNVCEWCQDWYNGEYYFSSPLNDPRGPSFGTGRVIKGGGWCFDAWSCQSAWHNSIPIKEFPNQGPPSRFEFYGFRLVRNVVPQKNQ